MNPDRNDAASRRERDRLIADAQRLHGRPLADHSVLLDASVATLTIYECSAGHRDFAVHGGSKCTDGLCDRIAVPRQYVRKAAR